MKLNYCFAEHNIFLGALPSMPAKGHCPWSLLRTSGISTCCKFTNASLNILYVVDNTMIFFAFVFFLSFIYTTIINISSFIYFRIFFYFYTIHLHIYLTSHVLHFSKQVYLYSTNNNVNQNYNKANLLIATQLHE